MSKTAKNTVFIVLSIIFFIIGLALKESGFLMGIPIAAIAILILYRIIYKKTEKSDNEFKLKK